MTEERRPWIVGRLFWAFVLLVEILFLVQVMFSDQRWESLLAMIGVNVFFLPVVGVLFAILAIARRSRRR